MKNIETIKESEFLDFYNSRTYNANCFNDDGSLNKNYNSFKSTGIIAQIFEEHWDSTYLANKQLIDKFRPNAPIEVQKIIDCYNKNLGCSLYECPTCHDIVFIGHTCKSRFCSSCGYKYKNQRVESVLQTAYNCQHRQIVFTVPEQLRKYFFFPFENRINLLFQAVRDTIYSILNQSFKTNKKGILKKYTSKIKYTPGFFAFLDHNDNKHHQVSVCASQFILILLRHLLPSQFKIIRYYGFYRKKHSLHSKMIPLIKKHCRNFRKQLLKYQLSISLAFNRDPYNCPKCDTKMNFVLCIN